MAEAVGGVIVHQPGRLQEGVADGAADETETEMEYINMAVDNSMLDDYSLYVYLADSDAE